MGKKKTSQSDQRVRYYALFKPYPLYLYVPSLYRILFLLLLISPFIYTILTTRHTVLASFFTIYFSFINLFTFIIYVYDKRKSTVGHWRISEKRLHYCEMLGGWPAAVLAVGVLRHTILKADFQNVLWGIVGVWLVGLYWYGRI